MWVEQAIHYLQVDFRSICAKLTNERRKVVIVFEYTESLLEKSTTRVHTPNQVRN